VQPSANSTWLRPKRSSVWPSYENEAAEGGAGAPPSPYDEGVESAPEHVRELARRRQVARNAHDFALADALRDEIAASGYAVRDTAAGAVVERRARFEACSPESIASVLVEPPTLDVSVHLLYEGFPGDLERFLDGIARSDLSSAEIVIVDAASGDGDRIEDLARAHPVARVCHLDRDPGWAVARNAGLRTSLGGTLVMADLSVEPTGEILEPLRRAVAEQTVAVAGPFGLVSDDLRSWHSSDGPEVDAVEGYVMAFRREIAAKGLIRDKFTWYRNADIDFSFQVRSEGLRAVVVPLDVRRHEHRGWSSLSDEERARRSKRNHYVFFDRWKHHEHLLLARGGGG